MKIGLLRETKIPEDNRVAFTPKQIKFLQEKFPHIKFKVQSSKIRAYSDKEYLKNGIQVVDAINDCDLLIGINETDFETLLRGKHYLFFGHISKMQPYNKSLFKALLDNKATFSDYEYLVDNNGKRLVTFGWYAGVVGVYYTLRGWGLRNGTFDLPMPHMNFSMEELISNLRNVDLGNAKILVTGRGHVSKGAQYVLEQICATKVSVHEYLKIQNPEGIIYSVATLEDLVHHKGVGKGYDREEFRIYPERYMSKFDRFATTTDILISCHFWDNRHPVYLTEQSYLQPNFRIKMIGDITCDIKGSIMSTLRSSTHSNPFYDYNPITATEEKAFSSKENITVMAVDTCPNALPRETSEYFGEQLIKYVMSDLFKSNLTTTPVLDKSTILYQGELTEKFSYLSEYVKTL